MVEAHAASSPASWASAPDSGHSVDNLAPAMPAPLAANYVPGSTSLHWGRNTEADLAGYRVYRGGSPAFVPGPSNLVATPLIHGNESLFAVIGPGGTTGTPGDLPLALALGPMTPNPAREGSSLRLALTRATGVRLAVHDARGGSCARCSTTRSSPACTWSPTGRRGRDGSWSSSRQAGMLGRTLSHDLIESRFLFARVIAVDGDEIMAVPLDAGKGSPSLKNVVLARVQGPQ